MLAKHTPLVYTHSARAQWPSAAQGTFTIQFPLLTSDSTFKVEVVVISLRFFVEKLYSPLFWFWFNTCLNPAIHSRPQGSASRLVPCFYRRTRV